MSGLCAFCSFGCEGEAMDRLRTLPGASLVNFADQRVKTLASIWMVGWDGFFHQ